MANSNVTKTLTTKQWACAASALGVDVNIIEGHLHAAIRIIQSADTRLDNMSEADVAGRLDETKKLAVALSDAVRLVEQLEDRLDAEVEILRV